MLSRRAATTGIDLGRHTVKLVRLEPGADDRPVLSHWGMEPVDRSVPDRMRARASALSALLRRVGLKSRQLGSVYSAVGGRDVCVRQVVLPALTEDELRRALPFEARKHLPLESLKEPCLDFQIVGDAPAVEGGGAPGKEVVLVAAPRAQRDEVLRILDAVGIDPMALGAEPLPVVNAVLDAYPLEAGDGARVVLDLGAESSVLAAVAPGGDLYVRAMEFTCEGPAERSPEDCARNLAFELEETFRFLAVRQRIRQVARVYVCGGGALVAGLKERTAAILGTELVPVDPLTNIQIQGDAPPAEDRVRLVSAVGLAAW